MAEDGVIRDILPGRNPPRPVLQVLSDQAAFERHQLQMSNGVYCQSWIAPSAVSSGTSGPLLSYASAAPPARPGLGTSQRTILPINKLSPYLNNTRWTIQARVTSKSPVKPWCKSKKKGGKVLNVNLADESGEIKATVWNETAMKYASIFEVGKMYYISGGYLKEADERFSGGIKNDYTLTLTDETDVEVGDLPTIQYNPHFANIENDGVQTFVGKGPGHAVTKCKRKLSAAGEGSSWEETDTKTSMPESTGEGTPATKCRKKETATEDTPVETAELGQDNLKCLHHELYPVSHKWYSLGVQLQVPVETLKCIREEHSAISECLLETITTWLKHTNPPPTWKALAEALESPPVAERSLARQLRNKYCLGRGALTTSQGGPKELQVEGEELIELQKAVPPTPTNPEQQPEAALGHPLSRKRSRQEDRSETSSAKRPKRSTAKKNEVRMRRAPCGKCVGCQPIKKEDCGECTACRDKVKFGGPGRRKQACLYQECQKLKYTSKNPRKDSNNSTQSKGRCRKCIGCLQKKDCGQCKACKGKKKFGGDGKSYRSCRYRECQKLKYVHKPSKKFHPSPLGPSATLAPPTEKRSEQKDDSEANSAKQQKQCIENDQDSSVPLSGVQVSCVPHCSVLLKGSKGPENKDPESNDSESKDPENKIPENKDAGNKGPEGKGPSAAGKIPGNSGPESKEPEGKGAESKITEGESKVPNRKVQRRPRCGECIACLRKDNCGECKACKKKEKSEGERKSHQTCKYRECQKLKYTKHPAAAIPRQSKQCGKCIGCLQKYDCRKCEVCRGKGKFGGTDSYYKQCIYRVCQKAKYTPKIPIKVTASEPPGAPMVKSKNPTSNSSACIPTNSKLWIDASGPGITTSGEHGDTTTESMLMDSGEGTINNDLTESEDATAATPPTKNEETTAQIVIMNKGKGATTNQGPTRGESNVTAKDTSTKRKDAAGNELALEHDPSLAIHDDIAGPQDDELDTKPTLPELLTFPGRSGMMNIPRTIGEEYEAFGILLLNDEQGKKIDAIVNGDARAKNINIAILKRWLRGEGTQPATWRTLVQVLKDSDLTAVAEDIEAVKSSVTKTIIDKHAICKGIVAKP